MRKRLKLYVWHDVLRDYTDGIAFALAESVEEAREMVKEDVGCAEGEFDVEPTVYESKMVCHIWGGG